MSKKQLVLPCLRAKIGDWIYYVTVMQFSEISARVSMVDEIHKSEGLKTLIQRQVKSRTKIIVEYLKSQKQRFFNALIIGMYGGEPYYQDLDVQKFEGIEEDSLAYLNNTFGIMVLSGDEKLFAIDGQHRIKAIKDVLKDTESLRAEEVPVIFVAHQKTPDGLTRTRRLFSTLNRYAKPVSKSEIIAIDEEDNCAIITRNLVEDFSLLKDRIDFKQTRSINTKNKTAFTNIIVLYDFVSAILTNQKLFGQKVSGEDHKTFTHRRASDKVISEKQAIIQNLLTEMFEELPPLKNFLSSGKVNREHKGTSLLFRPIGQNIFFSCLKLAMDHKRKPQLLNHFAEDDFSLGNTFWKRIFWDSETERIKTDKDLQKFAFQLILQKVGVQVQLTEKNKKVFKSFGLNPDSL